SFLLRLTTVSVEDCRTIESEHAADPARRSGQRRLAREIVSLVHGSSVVEPVEAASALLFGRAVDGEQLRSIDDGAFDLLEHEIPATRAQRGDVVGGAPVDLGVECR